MRNLRTFLKVLSLSLLVAAMSIPGIWAQGNSTIIGTIKDPSGAVIPGAEVSVTNVATGVSRTTVTGDDGLFRVTNLIPGKYTVKATLTGFKTALSEELALSVGQTAHVELKLEVGDVTQSVTVTGAAAAVDVEQGRVSSLVSEQQIKDLPLNGRNIYQLMQTAPGVINTTSTVTEPGEGVNVNGGRANFNGFWLNGVSNKGLSGGTNLTPSVDSVQEFRIETLNFSAEYGDSSGSIVTVVSKNGTNKLDGSVYWFHRNDNLDAREFFDKEKPEFKRNQYGFTVGGPIRKNQTFFFGSFEGDKIRTGQSSLEVFESSAWGSYVQRAAPNSVAAFLYKNYPGRAFKDSEVLMSVGAYLVDRGYINTPSQANVDAFLRSSFGTAPGTLSATAPMTGETSFFTPDSVDGNQWSARIDHEFGQSDKLFGAFFFDKANGFFVDARPAFNSPQTVKGYQLSLGYTHTFSPRVLNEARAGLNRNVNDILAGTPGVPLITETGSGTSTFGAYNGYPQRFHENVFTYADILSVTRGRHGIKMGAEFRRNQENSEFNVGRPSYYFYDLIYLALDDPYYQVGGVDPHIVDGTRRAELASNFRGWRNSEIGLFFNDDFKVTPRLTLNLGVRWDYYSRLKEVHNRATRFDLSPGGGNLFLGVAKGDFATADKLSANDWNNIAPRVGLAWDITGDGKTSFRLGYGVAYQAGVYNPLANSRWNPPYYSFNLICDVCGRPRENILYGPQTGEPVRASGPNTNPGGRLFDGNIIAYDGTNNNTTFLTGIPNPKMKDPYVQSFFVGLQRELFRNLTFEANYVGTLGRKLIRAENFNRFKGDRIGAPSPADGRFAGDRALNRINPNYGTMRFWENSVNTNYNALQVTINRRYSGGFALGGNYTWAKSLDIRSTWHSGATTSNGAQEGYSTDVSNQRLDYGRSVFDARHRLSFNYIWDMPFFKGSSNWFARQVVGGWQINGNAAFQSGQPFTPFCSLSFGGGVTGCDFNADGVNNDRPNAPSIGNSFSAPDRQDWVNPKAGPFNIAGTGTANPTTAQKLAFFGRPVNGTNGTLGRNTYEGPGSANVDFSLFKSFALSRAHEEAKLQLRFEFFNLFNRVNFYQPIPQINDPQFGRPKLTFDARQIQLALKVLF
ncbi:MAG TPA: TonB-dependent receptor [Acidobacteriota bacterium]|jgi:hypothetical protein